MARKRRTARTATASTFRVVGESAGAMFGGAISNVFANIRQETHQLVDELEDRVFEFRARMMKKMFASALIGVGALVLFVSLLMYLVDLFNLRWATAFLIVGVVILAIAFIIQATSQRGHGRRSR